MAMRKALLVGINEYPEKGDILAACLNDVNDFAEFLVTKGGFKYDDIRLLTERRATRAEILKRLGWLVRGAKAGDVLIFLYSGHGNRLATRNARGHVDKYYECICPFDFDWEGKNNISDLELRELFGKVPKGAKLIWISDSCYSGGLSEAEQAEPGDVLPEVRAVIPPPERRELQGKTMQLPADISWRVQTAIEKHLVPLTMSGVAQGNQAILISATKERQQAQ